MAYVPQTNSVVAFQSDPTKLLVHASVSGTVTTSGGNSSVQLVGGNAVIGSVTAYQGVKPWTVELTSGSIATTVGNSSVQLLAGNAMVGSVTAYQGGTPWVITGSIQGGGGGVQYTEDTAQTSVTATAILFRENDTTSILGLVSPSSPLPIVGSVSGTVATNPSPASVQLLGGINVIGSVATLQGTNPWLSQIVSSVATRPTPASVQLLGSTNVIGSVATLQGTNPWIVQLTSGSIATTVGNSSVMITPGINTIGSVATLQGTNPWIVQLTSGSVITTGGNSSVMLTQGTNTVGSIATLQGTNPWTVQQTSGSVFAYQAAGSVMAVSTTVNTGNSSVQLLGGNAMIGSVTAYQGATPWVITGSIQGGGGGTQYVEDTAQTSVTATAILFRKNDSTSIMGVISPANPLPVGGSIAALQGTNPWFVQLTSGSIITSGGNSSVQVVGVMPTQSVMLVPGIGVLGSVATLQGTNPWIVQPTSGSVLSTPGSVQLLAGTNAIGSVTALQGTNPWVVQTTGSVLNQYREDVLGSSVVGVAMMFKRTDSASLMSAVSPNYPLPVQGSVAVLQGTQPWLSQIVTSVATRDMGGGVSSVQLMAGTNAIGSVTALQGTNPWVIGNTSVLLLSGLNTIGSVAVLQAGTVPWPVVISLSSIAGTYAEDAAHSDGERGLFNLGVRNDMVTSFASANRDYTPIGVDSFGRVISKPHAPEEARIYGVSSTVNTAPSSLIAAGGAGLRNYITDLWIANTGSVATLVSFRDGDASIIGKTIAPAGGGSNIIALATPMRTHALNSQIEFTANVATSILHVTAFGYKAP